MKHTIQDMDALFAGLYQAHQGAYAMPAEEADEAIWQNWKKTWRDGLKKDLRGFPYKAAPLQVRVLQSRPFDTYTMYLVQYNGEAGMLIPALLLVPSEGLRRYRAGGPKMKAVIALAGHGAGITEICGLTPEGKPRKQGEGYQKDFALALCQRGFVVLAPEMPGFGLRRFREDCRKGPGQSSCFRMSTNLLMMGLTMAGLRVRDVMRSLDYLQALPFVDAGRIGGMGISGGGTTLMYTAALDERLRANVISGAACTYADSILSIFHCTDNYVPDIYCHAEMCDVLGLIAPRPLLLEAGRDDDIFPLRGVLHCASQLEAAYRKAGAGQNLAMDIFEGGHQISGRLSYDFLMNQL